jgi:hypothetical protein
MNATQSRDLKADNRVRWQGKADNGGKITGTSWNAVTIAWDNGQLSEVQHGDMRKMTREKK